MGIGDNRALLIGAGGVPGTVEDAEGIARYLRDASRCGYADPNVVVLREEYATRADVLRELDELASNAIKDSTVIVFFSGHGIEVQTAAGPRYYLLTFGYDLARAEETCVSGEELAAGLDKIRADRLVLLLDCCHAGGFGSAKLKDGGQPKSIPMPPNVVEALSKRSGRWIISACAANESALAGKPYSLFTRAVIEALCGKGNGKQDGFVRMMDLYGHARESVPAWARRVLVNGKPHEQHPAADLERPSENFTIAHYAAANFLKGDLHVVALDLPKFDPADSGQPAPVPNVRLVAQHDPFNVAGRPNPYLGLQPFTYLERGAFGGRASAIEAAAKMVTDGEKPLMLIAGASGSGKSSFAQAGLLPRLEREYALQDGRKAVLHPGADPLQALRRAAQRQLRLPDVAAITREHGPDPYLIVIDQFEEVFSADPTERDGLIQWLADLPAFQTAPVHVILTLRSDYLDELFACEQLWKRAMDCRLDLRAMNESELREAIQKPLQAAIPGGDVRFEPALLNRLAADAAGQSSLLPLLAVTLEDLWSGGELKLAQFPGLADAITRRADRVLQFTDDGYGGQVPRDSADQSLILDMLLELVHLTTRDETRLDVRITRPKAALLRGEAARARVLDDLIRARLVISEGDQSSDTVRITHEALLREWRRLAEAIADARARNYTRLRLGEVFEQLYQTWQESGRADDWLLRGTQLAQMHQVFGNRTGETLAGDQLMFLRASEAHEQSALQESLAREKQLKLALAASRSRELAALALPELDTDPELALILALEGARAAHTFQSEDALRQALLASHVRRTLRAGGASPWGYFATYGQFAVGAESERAALFRVDTGARVAWLPPLEDRAFDACVTPDGGRAAVVCGARSVALLIDPPTGGIIATLEGHDGRIWRVRASPDSRLLITASQDGTARSWDARDGAPRQLFRTLDDSDGMRDARFSADGSRVVTADQRGRVTVFDASNGKILAATMPGPQTSLPLKTACFSPDGALVLSSGDNARAELWDLADSTAQPKRVFAGHAAAVRAAEFSPDGRLVVTAGEDASARIWECNPEAQDDVMQLKPQHGSVQAAWFSGDGALAYTYDRQDAVRGWDHRPHCEEHVLQAPADAVGSFEFLTNDALVVLLRDGIAHVVRIDERDVPAALPGEWPGARSAISADGRTAVMISTKQRLQVVATVSGVRWIDEAADTPAKRAAAAIFTSRRVTDTLRGALSADGTLLAKARMGTITVMDVRTAAVRVRIKAAREGWVDQMRFTPDGLRLVSAGSDGALAVWRLKDGRKIQSIDCGKAPIWALDLSPDGSRAVVGFAHRDYRAAMVVKRDAGERAMTSATVCALADGTIAGELAGHGALVRDVRFSADSARIISASGDGTARIWDAADFRLLSVLRAGSGARQARLSPDGRRAAVLCDDGCIRVYLTRMDDLITLAAGRVTRDLSDPERKRYIDSV